MEEFLLNPNVVYLAIVVGVLFAFMAVLTPGTGLFELGALFALLFAGWGVYNLPSNIWALVVLLVGAVIYIVAVRLRGQRTILAISIVTLMVGSLFIIRGDTWWRLAINPFLGILIAGLSGTFIWIATLKVMESQTIRPTHDLEGLIGATGEAKTAIQEEGSVQVHGELWTAHSVEYIPAGTQIRVTGRDGFILEVEPLPET